MQALSVSSIIAWPPLVVLAAGLGTLFLIGYLVQYRDKPGAKWFIVTLLGQAVFCFSYGIGLAVYDPTIRFWLEIVAFVGLSWLGVPFLGFALGYTGREQLLDSWVFRCLLVFPVASTIFLPLNPYHELFISDFEITPTFGVATATYTFEPIAFVGILGAGTVVGIGAALHFDTVVSYGPLYRGEAIAVALSPVPPIVGLFPWLFGFGPAATLNTIAIGMLPHVLLDAYAFVGKGMFEISPATNRVAERSTMDNLLDSPVIVLEENGRIVDVNDAAQRRLELDREAVITRPISRVFGDQLEFSPATGELETDSKSATTASDISIASKRQHSSTLGTSRSVGPCSSRMSPTPSDGKSASQFSTGCFGTTSKMTFRLCC